MNVEQGWIERFEAFARSKPADATYRPTNSDICALTQFSATEGVPASKARRLFWTLPPSLQDVIIGAGSMDSSGNIFDTFGALADRLAAIVDPNKGDLEKGV